MILYIINYLQRIQNLGGHVFMSLCYLGKRTTRKIQFAYI